MMGEFVSLNGRLVPKEQACIGITDRGFLLGDGLFETIRIKNGTPLAMPAHLTRLRAGADVLGFPTIEADMQRDVRALIEANQVCDGVLRITVTRGEGQRGVAPPENPILNIVLTASPMVLVQTPMRVCVIRQTCRNECSPLFRLKSLNYLDSILARKEAAEHGADDGILLNTAGWVAETSVGNLLLKWNGKWMTPPIDDGALPGTARASLIAADLVGEQRFREVDLVDVQAAFMVNALSLRAITHIDEKALAFADEAELAAIKTCLDF